MMVWEESCVWLDQSEDRIETADKLSLHAVDAAALLDEAWLGGSIGIRIEKRGCEKKEEES